MNKRNLLKICLQVIYPTNFCIICIHFYYGKKLKCLIYLKPMSRIKLFCAEVVTTNGFVLNHDKSLKIYFFCVKHQAKNDFLKDVESTVVYCQLTVDRYRPNMGTYSISIPQVIACVLGHSHRPIKLMDSLLQTACIKPVIIDNFTNKEGV